MKRIQFLLSTTLLGAAVMATPAFAQAPASGQGAQMLEEIVVTAERRTSDVQRTAASVSVRSGDELSEEGRFSIKQVIEDVPGVAFFGGSVAQAGNDIQGAQVVIRGMSANQSAQGGASALSPIASTAVYVDGVYEGFGSQYDLERVEVLRGPQGTLYGRSATGGVLAYHTRNPNLEKFEANLSGEFANYDIQHYSGAINVPLADTLAVRLSADQYDRGEGFFNGKGGARKKTGARVKILFQPNDKLSVLVGGALEDNKNKFGLSTRSATAAGVISTTPVVLLSGENSGRQVWAEVNYDLGFATLTYLPAFRKWSNNDTQFVGLFQGNPLVQRLVTPYSRFWTHELRLASNNTDSPFTWQTGLFLYNNQVAASTITGLRNGGLAFASAGQKETDAWGVFGEGTYKFTDSTRLTVGVRYDNTQVENPTTFTSNTNFGPCGSGVGPGCTGPGTPEVIISRSLSGAVAQAEFTNFNYKVRLEHDLTPQNLIFASISTGFIPGDVGVQEVGQGPATRLEVNKVDAETLTAYEIGSKNRFFNNSVQLNVGAFFYDYGGFLTLFQPVQTTPGNIFITVPAQNIGLEAEALWQITPNDRLGLTYAYVRSEYKDKPANFAAVITQKERALVPHTVTANYDHTFQLSGGSTLRAGIDVRWESSSTSANLAIWNLRAGLGRFVERDAMAIGNLNATWTSADARFQVSGYVRNFTDEDRILYENVSTNGINVTQPDPRQYGVVLSAKF